MRCNRWWSWLPPIDAGADGGGIGHLVLDRLEFLFELLQSGIVHPATCRDSFFPKGIPNPEELSCDVLIRHQITPVTTPIQTAATAKKKQRETISAAIGRAMSSRKSRILRPPQRADCAIELSHDLLMLGPLAKDALSVFLLRVVEELASLIAADQLVIVEAIRLAFELVVVFFAVEEAHHRTPSEILSCSISYS